MSSILQGVKNVLNNVSGGESINGLPSSVLSPLLNSQNAKISDATLVISELMNFGTKENLRFEAAKEVLHMHGARKDDSNNGNIINIVVQNYDGDNNREKLDEMFNPKRIIDIESDQY